MPGQDVRAMRAGFERGVVSRVSEPPLCPNCEQKHWGAFCDAPASQPTVEDWIADGGELLDDDWDMNFDPMVNNAAVELSPDTDECPPTVRSTPTPPIINVAEPTVVETVLIQSLDLALTELSQCRLQNQELMANLVEKENALHEAQHIIAQITAANENLYNGLVLQKTHFQTILANQAVPSKPEASS